MGGSSMSSIMLMVTMVVLSWRSSMMERHTILNTLGMGMVDMFKMNMLLDLLAFMKNTRERAMVMDMED